MSDSMETIRALGEGGDLQTHKKQEYKRLARSIEISEVANKAFLTTTKGKHVVKLLKELDPDHCHEYLQDRISDENPDSAIGRVLLEFTKQLFPERQLFITSSEGYGDAVGQLVYDPRERLQKQAEPVPPPTPEPRPTIQRLEQLIQAVRANKYVGNLYPAIGKLILILWRHGSDTEDPELLQEDVEWLEICHKEAKTYIGPSSAFGDISVTEILFQQTADREAYFIERERKQLELEARKRILLEEKAELVKKLAKQKTKDAEMDKERLILEKTLKTIEFKLEHPDKVL